MNFKFIVATFLFLFYTECLNAQVPRKKNNYNLFFIGDAGDAYTSGKTTRLLKSYLENFKDNSAVVFLGDNIYPHGMPDSNSSERKNAEKAIKSQMDILKDYQGKIIFIPGNHDWKQGKTGGLAYINNQERFVENYLNKGNVFLPDNGCPGPVEISISDSVVMLIIDTEWWLYKNEKPGKTECDISGDADFILKIRKALERNMGKQIIVVAHHPLYSYGIHGGYHSLREHFFPLVQLNKALWIPLPVLGTAYVLFRKNIQDINNKRYQQLKDGLTDIFKPCRNLIYVSGHEHNLQMIKEDDHYFIISGSGSKATYVKKKTKALFGGSKNGFVQIAIQEGKRTKVTFIESQNKNPSGKIVFEKELQFN